LTARRRLLNQRRGPCLTKAQRLLLYESPETKIMQSRAAKFTIGQVVKHRVYPFRGVIYDVDPIFANTEEWYRAIPPEIRPSKDQPFYHLYAENDETQYIAYVSEQNLLPDDSGAPIRHPQVEQLFVASESGFYKRRINSAN
jgi:heat shock protein HspQ